jgi:RHS repeat-associated protein
MKKFLTTGFLLLLLGSAFGQDEVIILNSPLTEDFNVITRGTIILKPGFHAAAGINFSATIDNSLLAEIEVSGNNLTAVPDGGDGTYAYQWSTGETGPTISTDGKGIFSVKITDSSGDQDIHTHDFGTTDNDFDHNFVKTEITLISGVNEGSIDNLNEEQKSTTFNYLDGLGRQIQTVAKKASPSKRDIVQHIEYDNLGRQVREYLPYAVSSQNGAFRSEAATEQRNYYFVNPDIANSVYPYAEKVFDNSPLNRVMEQGAPGADWQPENSSITNSGHTVKMNYLTNTSADGVIKWTVDNSGNCLKGSTYAAGTLFKNETIDENGHSVLEFTDLTGKTILKKTNGSVQLLTYYVYDDFNRLRYVFPPKAIALLGTTITPTSLSELIYYYEYDHKGRMTEKKIPGADPVLMIYDRRDRLVLSQDGNLAAQDKWNFTKYDILNRPILSGIVQLTGVTYNQLETAFASHTVYCENISTTETYKYTLNLSYPSIAAIAETDLLTVNYYDNYNSLSAYGYSFSLPAGFDAVTRENNPINQLTGSIVWNLDKTEYYVTVKYYNEYNRLIQSISENHLNGLDRATIQYDFTGKMTQSKLSHTVDASMDPNEKTIWEFYEYDHVGRITKYYHQYGNNTAGKILMTAYTYNENGEQIEKKIHSEDAGYNYLQEVNYAYNIRGWLTKINDADFSDNNDLFGMELLYNNPITEIDATIDENYNGNITGMFWNTNGTFKEKRGYGFEYDDINRLSNSVYGSETNWSNGLYDVQGITYDLNGNIMSLSRNAGATNGEIDNLAYVYNGNKLDAVGDYGIGTKSLGFKDGTSGNTSTEYQYDANGNMTRDLNKSLEIEYNLLNLPSRVSDYSYQHWLTNKYDAAGNKLSTLESNLDAIMQTTDVDGKYYLGNFIYNYTLTWEDGGAVPAALPGGVGDPPPYVAVTEWDLAYVLTPEGRITLGDAGEVNYEYFLKDHLGNTRVVFADYDGDKKAELIQEDSYYPFGMQMTGLSERISGLQPNQYLYNGKELREEMGLDWYDYGLRMYDPVLGRWFSIDLASENYISQSNYHFAANNPLTFREIDGAGYCGDYYTLYGQYLGSDGIDDNKAYIAMGGDLMFASMQYETWRSSYSVVQELPVSNSTLLNFAGLIYGESSGDYLESYAIGSAVMNFIQQANNSGYSHNLNDIVSKPNGFSFAVGDKAYKEYLSSGYLSNSKHSTGAAINAVMGGNDYSNGAIKWDGGDLGGVGRNQWKPSREGVKMYADHFTTFSNYWSEKKYNGNYIWPGLLDLTNFHGNSTEIPAFMGDWKGMTSYRSTAAHGGTIFWQVNPDVKVNRGISISNVFSFKYK